MKKSMMMKIFGAIIATVMIMFVSTSVLAVTDTDEYEDLFEGNGTSQNGTNNTNTNDTNTNSNTNTPVNLNTNGVGITNNTNSINTNSNYSYNNTNLPATGIQDSIPTVLLIVVFGISAVYAYKKVKDYQQL